MAKAPGKQEALFDDGRLTIRFLELTKNKLKDVRIPPETKRCFNILMNALTYTEAGGPQKHFAEGYAELQKVELHKYLTKVLKEDDPD